MSTFNFTAPTISPEEEKAEYDALSQMEKDYLHQELYGLEDPVAPPNPVSEELLEELYEHLRELNDEAYEKAPPELVAQESPPLAWLRFCNDDPAQAAAKLVNYWKVRRFVFQENAYLPMTLEGAMRNEREHLEKAIYRILPPDSHGRPVVFFDRIRCTRAVMPRESVWKVVFYTLSCVARQHEGYVAIQNMKGCDLYKHFDRIMTRKNIQVFHAFPMRLKAFHLCTGSGKSVLELILPVFKKMFSQQLRLHMVLHKGTDGELYNSFQGYGLGDAHMNALCKGALHNMSSMDEWTKRQLERERRL